MENNFNKINKEADKVWSGYVKDLEKTTSKSISDAYASMSSSQKEAAKVQLDAASKLFDDPESALNNIKKGGVRKEISL